MTTTPPPSSTEHVQYLVFAFVGVVKSRSPENEIDLLPTPLIAVFEMQETFQLRHSRGGGEVFLQ